MTERRDSSIGPHQLSQLEHDVFTAIDLRLRPAEPEEIQQAVLSEPDVTADSPAASRPPASRSEVERALQKLERLGFIEKISRSGVEIWRLTPWGTAVAARARFQYRWQLDDWRAAVKRGHVDPGNRPSLSAVVVKLAPCDIGASFNELAVGEMDLPLRAINALCVAGVDTVGKLCRMTAAGLLELKNIGPKTVRVIERRLHSRVLELARASSSPEAVDDAPEENDERDA